MKPETNVSKAFPERWVEPARNLFVVFNGQPVEVSRFTANGFERTVFAIAHEAAKTSGHERYWDGQERLWDCRDAIGRLIPFEDGVPKLHWDSADRLYINLRPGIGA